MATPKETLWELDPTVPFEGGKLFGMTKTPTTAECMPVTPCETFETSLKQLIFNTYLLTVAWL
jgi:hypothetical protein